RDARRRAHRSGRRDRGSRHPAQHRARRGRRARGRQRHHGRPLAPHQRRGHLRRGRRCRVLQPGAGPAPPRRARGPRGGPAMAGAPEPYAHLPFFYSDLFDLGYEAVGDLDSDLTVVEDWTEPFREGVVYYLEGKRVRGVLLWNVWGQVDAARELIASRGPFRPEDLKGRITGG